MEIKSHSQATWILNLIQFKINLLNDYGVGKVKLN
jgi:hypothetical protein